MSAASVTAAGPAAEAPARPLSVTSLAKHFGQVTALDGISFSVRAGECFGLLGPNGAGKTTVIRSIVGRVRPDSGTLLVFGHPAGSAEARAAIGWVPQELALYPLLTCRENLAAFGQYQGLSDGSLETAIAWCLEWAALGDRANEAVKTLSGGMKRRLNMAAGLIHRPKLVLMDEPTAGVDPQSRNRIFEMIEGLRAHGMAVIYTTHYMEEAERLCDRIAIVDHGRVIALGTRDELVRQSFGERSTMIIRFPDSAENAAPWAQSSRGQFQNHAAQFAIEGPSEIAPLLESAKQAGLEVLDVSLRRPNLESVFLQLTGRALRE